MRAKMRSDGTSDRVASFARLSVRAPKDSTERVSQTEGERDGEEDEFKDEVFFLLRD